MRYVRRGLSAAGLLAGAGTGYLLVVRGAVTLDLGIGRRVRPLDPVRLSIAAPREAVFDVIAAPYLGKTPRAMRAKLDVLERGSDMVVAAHFTRLAARLTATTVETVRFERPERVAFRLLRGPVPHLVETFELRETDDGTELEYTGEIGADLWHLGAWWAGVVAAPWERTVEESLVGIQAEAERRARTGRTAAWRREARRS